MRMRLIDAESLKELFPDNGEGSWTYNATAKAYIDAQPTIQPEIIRCKDCKWCVEDYDTDGNVPYWICKNWDAGTDADGFCHEAERRENEAD